MAAFGEEVATGAAEEAAAALRARRERPRMEECLRAHLRIDLRLHRVRGPVLSPTRFDVHAELVERRQQDVRLRCLVGAA